MKLQASQGYRSDSVRPSTHSASPGLLFFRKDKMPSEGETRGDLSGGPWPRADTVTPLPQSSPSQGRTRASDLLQETIRQPRRQQPGCVSAEGATGLGASISQTVWRAGLDTVPRMPNATLVRTPKRPQAVKTGVRREGAPRGRMLLAAEQWPRRGPRPGPGTCGCGPSHARRDCRCGESKGHR